MRNLTIIRAKRFAGCLGKIKIYIEDPDSRDLTISGVTCRKLGEIKNGEQVSFEIGENALKVFVIADKLSKDYCNDYYQLPEGQDDVCLTGRNVLNPAVGNAFRFDNNDSPDVVSNRKRGQKKGLVIFVAAVLVGLILGFSIASCWISNREAQPKAFSSDGMGIVLTDDFKKTDIDADKFTVSYASDKVAVFALKESFSLASGFEDYTLSQYANLVINANGLTSASVKNDGNLKYFTYDYTNPTSNEDYTYVAYVYKSGDAFWLIQFATLSEDADEYSEQIAEWARSVKFSK